MSFMSKQILFGDWYEVETSIGTEIVDAELVGENPTDSNFDLYCEGEVQSFELKKNKYGARMSAPGYLDKTDWTLHDTKEDADKYLDDTYPEDD